MNLCLSTEIKTLNRKEFFLTVRVTKIGCALVYLNEIYYYNSDILFSILDEKKIFLIIIIGFICP